MKSKVACWLIGFYFSLPSVVLAQMEEHIKSTQQDTNLLTWALIKMLFVLLIVCLIAFFSLKYFLPKLTGLSNRGRIVEVIERYALEPRKTLYVIKAAQKYHLISASDQSVQHLTELDGVQVEAAIEQARSASAKSSGKSFASFLGRQS